MPKNLKLNEMLLFRNCQVQLVLLKEKLFKRL
nr:MAG TPA: hypothetical protein [Caudoviricetes sp.]